MTSAPVDTPAPAVAHSRRWWTLATVALAQLMVVLDATVVNIALPAAQADLGFSDGDRQWVITAYSLAFGSLLLLGGRLSDLWGRKRTFIIGLIGFAARLRPRRRGADLRRARRRPRAAGRVRRPARSDRARRADHDVHDPARSAPARSASSARSPAPAAPSASCSAGSSPSSSTGAGTSTSTCSSRRSRSSAPRCSCATSRAPARARSSTCRAPCSCPPPCSSSSTASRTPRPRAGTRR